MYVFQMLLLYLQLCANVQTFIATAEPQ